MSNTGFLIPGIAALLMATSCAVRSPEGPWPRRPADPPLPEPALPADAPRYVCGRASGPMTVDGRLDEPAWARAPWTADFVDIQGHGHPAPRHRTRAKMLWDDEYFYIAAELDEPHLWGTLTERDAIVYFDNDFEVFLDPSGSTHNYAEIEINALNTVWDLMITRPYRDHGRALHGWNIPGLRTAIGLRGTVNDPSDTDEGWTVEIAIPWAGLKDIAPDLIPPKPGHIWSVNFSRVQWRLDIRDGGYTKTLDPVTGAPRAEDNWTWSPTGLINIHYPERWGWVYFSEQPPESAPKNFELDVSELQARDLLRKIYHRQHAHRYAHARFTESLSDLNLTAPPAAAGALQLRAAWNQFQARWLLPDGRTAWNINDLGGIWKEEMEP
ncbi:MAG: carbohydrate-binding family 9-like protein [Kiritimatiellae bacterium]|nr:carbohydrate-binding family 9-like protein [Kiritimatiellia bacterium]